MNNWLIHINKCFFKNNNESKNAFLIQKYEYEIFKIAH